MSEEEKQDIIEFLRLFCKTKIDYCKLEKTDVLDILNYIDKLQKELDNSISKDIIRNKIKELEEKDKASSTNIYGYGVKFLKELLGE